MALDFFRIERGLELDELVQYLQGAGNPGVSGDSAAAPVGSVYTDNGTGALWTKHTAGTGTDKWDRVASETYVNNAVGATISWREPAKVNDAVTTTLPVGTPGSPITVDGVSITNNQRVLFSALTGGDGKNVYIYDLAAGTFAEDTNAETNGDALYVEGGTAGGKTFIYNGTNWVQSDQTSLDELGFIRAFIGKATAGNVATNYTSNNFVVDGTALQTAISALDAQFGANVSNGNFIAAADKTNDNIQSLDDALGANVTDGNYVLAANSMNTNIQALDTHLGPNFAAGNFIAANSTVFAAVTALDVEMGPNVTNGGSILAANKINQNIQALDTQVGPDVTTTTGTGGVLVAGNSVNVNLQAVDAALSAISTATTVTNVTTITPIDTVTAGAAKWFVRVELESDTTRVYATEVYALNDGGTGSDFTRYATLRLGTAIPGLVVSVSSPAAGQLRLNVTATSAVTVEARRASVIV
jgi:hypothetical protein